MTTTDPSLALLQDISQSGPSDPFDELDGTLTADGSGEGKEISWQSFISSKSPHGGMMLDLESNDAIDLGGKSPHGGMLVDLVSNDAIDLGGESHHRRMIVDMELKDPIDLGGEEVSYLSSKNENVPHSDPTKEVAPDEKHSDTIMPSETLDTQNSQDDHVVVGTYDEEFGQEVTVKQHQAWHFAANRRRRLIMCYLGCAILVIVVVLGAVLGTQNKQPSNSSSEVDSIDNPAPTTGNTGALFPGPSSLAPVDPSPTTAIAPGYPPSAVTSPNGTPTIVTAPNGAPISVPTSLTVDSALTQLLFTVSGSRLFESGSPQLTAANFLRNENRTNYDDAKTIQRYAILTMVASLLNGDMTSVGSIDECDWGVVVCASSGRITELAMTGMGLSGEIPPEISSLQALTTLDLSSNAIRGVLPDEFFSLQNLKYMYLDSNQLSGSLSSLIGNMVQLEVLYLGQNQFNGMIPATLPETLRYINFYRNNFSGQMPDRLLKPNTLFYVDLSFNMLTGTLPVNAVSLNLRHLYLSHNQLSGDIPSAYSLLPLEDLFLDHNQLTGTIPPGFSNSLLETLQIQGNELSDGALDSSLCLLDIFQDGVLVDLAADCAICSCSGRLCNSCL